jgi:hypothetical protein
MLRIGAGDSSGSDPASVDPCREDVVVDAGPAVVELAFLLRRQRLRRRLHVERLAMQEAAAPTDQRAYRPARDIAGNPSIDSRAENARSAYAFWISSTL